MPIWERGTGRVRDCLSWQSTILTWQGTSVHVTPGPVARGTRASTPCAGLHPYPSRALRFVRAHGTPFEAQGLIPNRRQGPYPLRTHAVRRVAHRILFPLVHGLNGADKAEPSEGGGRRFESCRDTAAAVTLPGHCRGMAGAVALFPSVRSGERVHAAE
jgi:hypothetical protein